MGGDVSVPVTGAKFAGLDRSRSLSLSRPTAVCLEDWTREFFSTVCSRLIYPNKDRPVYEKKLIRVNRVNPANSIQKQCTTQLKNKLTSLGFEPRPPQGLKY